MGTDYTCAQLDEVKEIGSGEFHDIYRVSIFSWDFYITPFLNLCVLEFFLS